MSLFTLRDVLVLIALLHLTRAQTEFCVAVPGGPPEVKPTTAEFSVAVPGGPPEVKPTTQQPAPLNITQPNAVGVGPVICCLSFYERRVKLDKLRSYVHTDIRCSKPAVVLTTMSQILICVDPSTPWVQRAMTFLDNKNVGGVPGGPPEVKPLNIMQPNAGGLGPDMCCLSFYRRRVKLEKLRSYLHTDSRCTKPAVVLMTMAEILICFDPNAPWVQSAMTFLDNKNSNG